MSRFTFSLWPLSWLLILSAAMGLAGQERLSFVTVTSRSGLSSDSLTCLLQDRQGFIWAGSADGLNRFDGYRCRVFKHHAFAADSLSDNTVTALLLDRTGSLWVATNVGLDRFDAERERFVHFGPLLARLVGSASPRFHALAEDRQGRLLVIVSNVCCRLDPGDGSVQVLLPAGTLIGLTAVVCDDQDRIWLGHRKGVSVFASGRLEIVTDFEKLRPLASEPELSGTNVSSIHYDADRRLAWVTSDNGLFIVAEPEPGRFRTHHYRHDPAAGRGLVSNELWCCTPDEHGNLWLGTGDGVAIADLQGGDPSRLSFVRKPIGYDDWFLHTSVRAIFEDRQSVLWMASYGRGLARAKFRNEWIECFLAEDVPSSGLVGASVLALAEDSRGQIWVGTNRGLNLYRHDRRKFQFFPNYIEAGDSPTAHLIRFILPERDGSLWICTMHTLKRFFPESGKVRSYFAESGPPTERTLYGRYMLRDRRNRLWLATIRGLWLYDEAADAFRPPGELGLRELGRRPLYTLFEDRAGRLWIGSINDGLFVHDPGTGSLRRFANDPADAGSISNDSILSIFQENEGTYWIGTRDGLNRLDLASGRFRRFFEEQGLPSSVIYSILIAPDNGLWLSTNTGLSRFDLANRSFRNYYLEDGLQNNEFNGNAYLRGRDGTLYFGGIKGMNIVRPRRTPKGGEAPPLVITGFSIVGRTESAVSPAIQGGPVTLDYRERSFTVEYALLDFNEEARKEYAYRLDGVDGDWVAAGSRNAASYANIAPGRYTFRVRAADTNGQWTPERRIDIVIRPPFWKTPGFRLLLGLLVFGLVAAAFFYQRLLYSKRLIERDMKLKADFSAMLVHDLRNPLTMILGFTKLLRRKASPVRLVESVGMIERGAERMLDLVNDILDLSKFEAGKMNIHLEPMSLKEAATAAVEMIRPLLEEKGLKLQLDLETVPPIQADGMRIGQVIANLLSNAVKFSPVGQTILVRLRRQLPGAEFVQEMEVVDRGPGIDPARKRYLFDKYAQLYHHGEKGVAKGTGLGLAVSKLIIDAHHGEIGYRRVEGKATVFYFTLPENQEATPNSDPA